MALLAYTIFTTTLVLQRKEAARPGPRPGSLTVPGFPCPSSHQSQLIGSSWRLRGDRLVSGVLRPEVAHLPERAGSTRALSAGTGPSDAPRTEAPTPVGDGIAGPPRLRPGQYASSAVCPRRRPPSTPSTSSTAPRPPTRPRLDRRRDLDQLDRATEASGPARSSTRRPPAPQRPTSSRASERPGDRRRSRPWSASPCCHLFVFTSAAAAASPARPSGRRTASACRRRRARRPMQPNMGAQHVKVGEKVAYTCAARRPPAITTTSRERPGRSPPVSTVRATRSCRRAG